MQAKGWMLFNALANRYHDGPKTSLMQHLPSEDVRAAHEFEVSSHDVTVACGQPRDLLHRIHWSHLVSPLKQLPSGLRTLIVASLYPDQASSLIPKLGVLPIKDHLSPPVAEFVAGLFYRDFIAKGATPPQLLPPRKLSFLLNYNKEQLMTLADHLGLYDLAADIRHIVDKAELQKLFVALTPSMQKFIKVCLVQRDWLTPPSLQLKGWNGQRTELLKMIHRRGLERLGKTLSGYPQAVVDFLSHVLDTGRGSVLLKSYSLEALPDIGPSLEAQVLNLVKFINDNR